MQATEDGEFYPEKDLDKNYKIPKRKAEEMSQPCNIQESPAYGQQTPLSNSYYNYQYDPSAYYSAYAQYYSQYNSNAPQSGSSVAPITQNIYNALSDIKEKPKNYKTNIFESTVPDVTDESLPKKLKLLFQPLFCKLCSAQLSSNLNAKMHYKSKNHEKKIRKWLVEYSEKTGEPLHKRARVGNEKHAEDAEKNPRWYHCDVCDLPLTGKLHAESHYMGKNHQKAVMGYRNPAGMGYFNAEGKWIRTKSSKSKLYAFENGEDNFGVTFGTQVKDEQPTEPTVSQKPIKPSTQTKFYCEVCNISTTCQEQLDSHFRGSKHQKKLKHFGLSKYTEQRDIIDESGITSVPGLCDALQPMPNGKPELNLSVYRTPSGDYYCPSCNITSNSEAQFLQHLSSKSHNKKSQKK